MSRPVLDVALALVQRDGRLLVARRHEAAHLGGLWEFPGGKQEVGESPQDAALRELMEECAVQATPLAVLPTLTCDYGDRLVHLTPIVCRWQAGDGEALGNAECRWVTLAEIVQLEMPEINATILAALRALNTFDST